MKKEARLLKDKALDALMLGIESFNRPYDRGRADSVLRDLSHAFEMLMKAAILHRNGRIRERPSAQQTIGFDACVRKGVSAAQVKFLTEDQALAIQMLNALRDARSTILSRSPSNNSTSKHKPGSPSSTTSSLTCSGRRSMITCRSGYSR